MAATSTTIDLSRLTPPELVEQLDFDAIVAAMVADVQALLPSFDATVDSDPAVKVLQVGAYRELLLRRQFQDAALQLFVAYAGGSNLDHLGALVGVARRTITPADLSTGAPAVMEGDDEYRQRIVLAPEAFSTAGPELAYVALAKGAAGDVLDASAISPAPGEVLVSVLSRTGDGTAPGDLVAAVREATSPSAKRPLGDAVSVRSAQIRNFRIKAQLFTFAGPDLSVVLATARANLDAYLTENRKLGRTLTRSGISAALTVAGVHRVVLIDPVDDVVCDRTQAGWCTDIVIEHGGYAS
ncbi:baseplate assembly protein [Sphingomonas pseudosanguinis]|uniref:Phage-related baseplate assembly protein n=1 Tax=Sphingomonas pseudosanguinis TaxID=413712 RepID=A0A7W6A8H0_9SPHN|nr:baseplate J/gp47 family protein [Sphingomonas pseudosanguinis]MBB3877899.1 phage-related baseplate assembly protein [Sphingomonas pseudosanguinis]MBN3537773.1 baseplate J/gp47 family protein [Sphingomonas pseudosanguinis]